MKKKTLITASATAVILAVAFWVIQSYVRTKVAQIVDDERAWDLRDASPQKIVIISEDGTVARYLAEDEDMYIGELQDTVRIPKSGSKVVTWYACDGQGTVCLCEEGERPAYAEPDSTSQTVGRLTYMSGCCPDTYKCLGYMDGWFKISISGTEGYISDKHVCWDAIDTM